QDGYVDYLAALNEAASEEVTVEINAAVLLAPAMDLAELSEPDRIRFFKMLGIEPPAKTPITFGRFPKIIKGQSAEAGLELVRDKPWSARRFPSFAKWLAERETLLDLAVEASQRPRCYLPLIRPATSEMANDLPLAPVRAASTIAEALVARATLRLNEGKTLEASQDLLACHRLARLVGSGPALMDSWIGLDLENSALHGDSVLLQSGKLSAADALAYRDELRRLRPAPSVADHFDRGERLLLLAFMTETFRNVEAPWMKWTFIPILHNALKTRFAVVWNAALRGANTDWDRWARALRTPNAAERRKQIEMLEAESRAFLKIDVRKLYWQKSPHEAGRQLGRSIASRLMPNIKVRLADEEEQLRVWGDLAQTGFALRAYSADFGHVPESLEALVPKYLSEVPLDRFAAKPLRYRREAGAYVLYSVGANGRDERGRGRISQPPGDDLAIWIPVTRPTSGKRPILSPDFWKEIWRAAVLPFAFALIGGLAVIRSRLTGKPRPALWLVICQGTFAVAGLALLICGAVHRDLPPLGFVSLGLATVATIGGSTLFVISRLKAKPLPVSFLLGQVLLLLVAYGLLWMAIARHAP
ncbi:MAG TPA: hypothetical protein VHX68_11185, partial [Planctomycetaceae bacterium]|nr:hypothetical protein [Planctomycetaceae bacterium]